MAAIIMSVLAIALSVASMIITYRTWKMCSKGRWE